MSFQKLPLSPWKLALHFFKIERPLLLLLILQSVIAGISPTIDSLLLKKLVDSVEMGASPELSLSHFSSSPMFFWVIVYMCWWEGWNVFWRIYDYLYLKIMPRLKGRILEELFNFTQYHSQKFFQSNMAGHITNQITESARSFEMIMSILIEKIIRKSSVVIFALMTLYSVHQSLAIVFLIWLISFFGVTFWLSPIIDKKSLSYANTKSVLAGKMVDSVSNINSIRMFNTHRFERKYINSYINAAVNADVSMQWFMLKLRYVLGASCTIMIVVIMYHLFGLRSQGIISVGDVVLVVTLSVAVVSDIYDFYQEIGDIFEQIGVFNQSVTLISEHSIVDIENAKDLVLTNGKIEFKNVTFQYGNLNDNLFSNKSIVIEVKQKVGLVGASGSGKTTFVNLISRLYELGSGQILIDSQDIKQVTQNSLRNNISFIPQEPILFHRTILENIKYGKRDASFDEIVAAAKHAHANEFIQELPDQYDTLCGERGNNLSGGQRQRIVIARAILKDAPILILDEATSSLDSETESYIQESLSFLMQNKTVLVIAHRLSTLLNMDRILVFKKGKIVEDGTHEQLIKNKKLYFKLWNAQVNGLIPDSI